PPAPGRARARPTPGACGCRAASWVCVSRMRQTAPTCTSRGPRASCSTARWSCRRGLQPDGARGPESLLEQHPVVGCLETVDDVEVEAAVGDEQLDRAAAVDAQGELEAVGPHALELQPEVPL